MTAFKDVFERYYTWLEGYMRNVRRFADKPAMIDPDTERSWTYRELDQACNQLSHALHADGTGHGSVVMLMLGNCPEFAFSYIAAQKNGAVCCPVNFRISAGELAYCIDDSRPSVLMYGAEFRDCVLQALALAAHRPARLVVVDGPGTEESVSYEEYTAGQATTPFEPDFEYSTFDETSRLYTSGTTGRPKAVPMTSINEVLSPLSTPARASSSCASSTPPRRSATCPTTASPSSWACPRCSRPWPTNRSARAWT